MTKNTVFGRTLPWPVSWQCTSQVFTWSDRENVNTEESEIRYSIHASVFQVFFLLEVF
jgi:hypothetical protein